MYGATILEYTLASLFPISYAIFDYPSPQFWRLPVEVQLVLSINRFFSGAFCWNFRKDRKIFGKNTQNISIVTN